VSLFSDVKVRALYGCGNFKILIFSRKINLSLKLKSLIYSFLVNLFSE